jgi:hypothetical protein
VRDFSLAPRFSEFSFLHLAAWGIDAIGLSALSRQISDWGSAASLQGLNLDGLLVLWHPPSSR